MALDITIAVIAALAQAMSATVGLIATTRPPAQGPRRLAVECLFVLAALVGVTALGFSAYRTSASQQAADKAQGQLMAVEVKNGQLLSAVKDGLVRLSEIKPPRQILPIPARQVGTRPRRPPRDIVAAALSGAATDEKSRRMVFMDQLRALWIGSHDHISPNMLLGEEWPPEDWLNDQLKRYGQTWRVRVNGPRFQTYAAPANPPTTNAKPFAFGQGAFGEGTFGDKTPSVSSIPRSPER